MALVNNNSHHTYWDYAWNIWRGCTEVGPGCDNCYAREFAKRSPAVLGRWGDDEKRVLADVAYMTQIHEYYGKLRRDKRRGRVLVGSMMDFFDYKPEVADQRELAFDFFSRTEQHIDYLLPTRRVGSVVADDIVKHKNVVLAVSAEDQRSAEAACSGIAKLYNCVNVFGLILSPLIDYVDLSDVLSARYIDWVVISGEMYNPNARHRRLDIEWVEEIIGQCREASVPVFVSQLGASVTAGNSPIKFIEKNARDISEWPEFLQVREYYKPKTLWLTRA